MNLSKWLRIPGVAVAEPVVVPRKESGVEIIGNTCGIANPIVYDVVDDPMDDLPDYMQKRIRHLVSLIIDGDAPPEDVIEHMIEHMEAGNEYEGEPDREMETQPATIEEPPACVRTDEQINEIMSYLLKLQEEVFGNDIPLNKDLCKSFVWNIPDDVYKAFRNSIDYGDPMITNPITLFYLFCSECPDDFMPAFLLRIYELIIPLKDKLIEAAEDVKQQYEDEELGDEENA